MSKIEAQLKHGEPILFRTGSMFPRDWPVVVLICAGLAAFGVAMAMIFGLATTWQVLCALPAFQVGTPVILPALYNRGAVVTDNRLIYKLGVGNEFRDVPLSSISAVHSDGVTVTVSECDGDYCHLGYVRDPDGLVRALNKVSGAEIHTLRSDKLKKWSWLFAFTHVLSFVPALLVLQCAFPLFYMLDHMSSGFAFPILVVSYLISISGLPVVLAAGVLYLGLAILVRIFLTADEATDLLDTRNRMCSLAKRTTLSFDRIPFLISRRLAGLLYGQRI